MFSVSCGVKTWDCSVFVLRVMSAFQQFPIRTCRRIYSIRHQASNRCIYTLYIRTLCCITFPGNSPHQSRYHTRAAGIYIYTLPSELHYRDVTVMGVTDIQLVTCCFRVWGGSNNTNSKWYICASHTVSGSARPGVTWQVFPVSGLRDWEFVRFSELVLYSQQIYRYLVVIYLYQVNHRPNVLQNIIYVCRRLTYLDINE